METKRLIVVVLLGMMIIVLWQPFMDAVARRMGYTLASPQTKTSTAPATAPADSLFASPGPGTPAGVLPATNPSGWSVVPADAGEIVRLGSATRNDPDYAIELAVNPRGAGVEQVVLNDYYLTLRDKEPFLFEKPIKGDYAELTRPLALRGVVVDGVAIDLTGATWRQVNTPATSGSQQVIYELSLARDGVQAITLRRTFTVSPRSSVAFEADGKRYLPLGYEISLSNTVVNHTDQPMSIALRFNALNTPPTEAERFADGSYILGWARDGIVNPAQWMTDSIREPKDLLADEERRPFWVGAMTTYFTAIHRFDPAPGGKAPVDAYERIDARTLTPDLRGVHRQNEVVIVTKPLAVAAGKEGSLASSVFFGPRKREVLLSDFYTLSWVQYGRSLVIVSGPCGFCTWQWLIDILFFILKSFHAVTMDWGLAIIGLVILVRILLHPISRKAQMSMLKFGIHAPEMAKIRERYKDDQETMNREMMRFYREHGGTQVMGCLPMFLQMPVWIALWQAMNTTFDLRHQPFFYGLTWITDLSKPDHLVDFTKYGWEPFHLFFITISGVNVLPFAFGILQFIQFKIQPKPPSMTPEQEQQQKMTQWMILVMMPVLLYASPSGLMIYMITSFVLGIIESKLVRKEFEEKRKNDARFQVVDADSPEAARATRVTTRRAEGGPKKKGFFAIIAEARERAEQMAKDVEKNRKKK